MNITSRQFAQTLLAMVADGHFDIQKAVTLFTTFLEKNNLLALTPHIIRYLELEREKIQEENKFTIASPYKLHTSMVNDILKTFKSEHGAEVEKHADADLIGGIVVKHTGVVYDASIKTQLRKLQETLSA
jgi:F0F1-type ATP synthase delta subunit